MSPRAPNQGSDDMKYIILMFEDQSGLEGQS